MKKIDNLIEKYLEHRLDISKELKHAIVMEQESNIKEYKEQIQKLDDIIKSYLNK